MEEDIGVKKSPRVSQRDGRLARMAVTDQLVRYHRALIAGLSEDNLSFFNRVMEAVDQHISTQHERSCAQMPNTPRRSV